MSKKSTNKGLVSQQMDCSCQIWYSDNE